MAAASERSSRGAVVAIGLLVVAFALVIALLVLVPPPTNRPGLPDAPAGEGSIVGLLALPLSGVVAVAIGGFLIPFLLRRREEGSLDPSAALAAATSLGARLPVALALRSLRLLLLGAGALLVAGALVTTLPVLIESVANPAPIDPERAPLAGLNLASFLSVAIAGIGLLFLIGLVVSLIRRRIAATPRTPKSKPLPPIESLIAEPIRYTPPADPTESELTPEVAALFAAPTPPPPSRAGGAIRRVIRAVLALPLALLRLVWQIVAALLVADYYLVRGFLRLPLRLLRRTKRGGETAVLAAFPELPATETGVGVTGADSLPVPRAPQWEPAPLIAVSPARSAVDAPLDADTPARPLPASDDAPLAPPPPPAVERELLAVVEAAATSATDDLPFVAPTATTEPSLDALLAELAPEATSRLDTADSEARVASPAAAPPPDLLPPAAPIFSLDPLIAEPPVERLPDTPPLELPLMFELPPVLAPMRWTPEPFPAAPVDLLPPSGAVTPATVADALTVEPGAASAAPASTPTRLGDEEAARPLTVFVVATAPQSGKSTVAAEAARLLETGWINSSAVIAERVERRLGLPYGYVAETRAADHEAFRPELIEEGDRMAAEGTSPGVECVRRGYRVIDGIRRREELEAAVAEVRAGGGRPLVLCVRRPDAPALADNTEAAALESLADRLLVNDAGLDHLRALTADALRLHQAR